MVSLPTTSTSLYLVICFSGKRKSGKDYVCNKFRDMLQANGIKAEIRGVSYPLKEEYARLHVDDLDVERLKSDGEYKEKYREDMVEFGDKIRNEDSGYWCRKTMENISSDTQVALISDCRRPTDIAYFRSNYHVLSVRVSCSIETREKRGFVFTPRIDDAETECSLDDFQGFDVILVNEDESQIQEELYKLMAIVRNTHNKL